MTACAAHGLAGKEAFQRLIAAIQISLADAVTRCFLIGALLIAVGFIAVLILREISSRKRREAPAET